MKMFETEDRGCFTIHFDQADEREALAMIAEAFDAFGFTGTANISGSPRDALFNALQRAQFHGRRFENAAQMAWEAIQGGWRATRATTRPAHNPRALAVFSRIADAAGAN